jgi:hypothetical protein
MSPRPAVEPPLVYRTSPWVLGIVALGLAISVAGTVLFARRADRWPELGLFAVLDVLFAAGLVEGLTARIVLGTDALEIRSKFQRASHPRGDFIRAVGEKGVPVALERRSGGWVKLPSLGSGPHANTVRAWIRKAPSGEGG